jgi:cytochrome b6-f complex iron-sulfur subunit
MERKEFFSVFGISAGMIFMAPALTSCSKTLTDMTGTVASGNTTGSAIDFTLDLTQTANASLVNNGGSVLISHIIIAKTASGVYVALSSTCTHQGGTVGYDSAANRFHCPNHGANFATDGSVLNGPAQTPLKKFNTQLTGTTLRVYA